MGQKIGKKFPELLHVSLSRTNYGRMIPCIGELPNTVRSAGGTSIAFGLHVKKGEGQAQFW